MSMLMNLYNLILKFKNKKEYESLAPVSNIRKSATLNMLINTMADEKNYNVALSGKYGAGKSSLIKSFFYGIRKVIYKPLYISLGMLGLEENEIDVNEFCQAIEKSIIQQIIYKEETTKLPDSNIKRVSKLKKRNVLFIMMVIIIMILLKINSLYIENYNEEIKAIIEKFLLLNKWYKIGIGVVVIIIILLISKLFANFLKKVDIKNIKFNFTNTEIEIEKTSTESLINKYMDELVYFFSMTDYNIVVIEDLDRFLEKEEIKDRVLIIFQKLKELNQILNSSKQIKRKITFLYVVKDDLFKNEEERTKFFDAIVPVIPVMSNYNSYAELKDRFEIYNIDDKIMQDISPYINDYRVIKNLKNEYELYQKEIKGSEIVKEKQLAMLALKNIRPSDYECLLNNRGYIYEIINQKQDYIDKKALDINEKIKNNKQRIKDFNNEKMENFQELKRLSVSNLYGKYASRSVSVALSVDEFLSSSMNYDKIKNTNIYLKDSRGYCFNESEIFEYFGGKENFLERANNIAKDNEINAEKLSVENKKLEKEKEDLDKKPFYELIEDNESIKINDEFVKMLLKNGYIDESYQDYMFKFKETKEINKNDYTFISNVRQYRGIKYDYSISNVEKVVEELNSSYFGTEAILNYSVIDYLITSNDNKLKEKQENCIDMLTELNENKENFIFGFINNKQNKEILLSMLHQKNKNTIYEIILNNSEKPEKIEEIIKNVLNIPEILDFEKTNNFIRDYIESKRNFLNWIKLNENIKKSLDILNVKFKELEENDTEFLEFVYTKNLYKLNSKMINLLFKNRGYSEQDFEEKNLSIIMHDTNLEKMRKYLESNKGEYINNCYLKTTGIKNDIKDVIECLNNWDISDENKREIIKNIHGQIKDIRDVDSDYYDEIMVKDKINPTWENYYYYYINSNEITNVLLQNIELNIENIKNQNVSSIKMSEEDETKFTNFRGKIARNNKLNISIYEQIIPVCWIILNKIEENEIDNERLKILVRHKIIKLNDDNLQVLYNQVPEIIDLYINNNIQSFINHIENFTLNEFLIYDIIKSSSIKFRDKNKIIEIINVEYINVETMKFIIDNYSQNKISKISEELKERILSSKIELNYKLIFLEKELDKNNSIELIDKYLKLLPAPYKYIANYEEYSKLFSIPKTKSNEKILDNLKNKGFKFTKLIKKNKITIYNKK